MDYSHRGFHSSSIIALVALIGSAALPVACGRTAAVTPQELQQQYGIARRVYRRGADP